MACDLKVLEKFGSTNARLREIFERRHIEKPPGDAPKEKPADDAHPATRAKWERWCKYWQWLKDMDRADLMEKEIRSRLEENLRFSLGNSRLYQAVDLAWDTPGITGSTIPLMLYAQKKIDIQACSNDLQRLSNANEFLVKNAKGEVTGINMPKFVDVSINLMRSYTTRRHAAQANKYNNLFPYLKYESRSTGQVGKLRADVMSQEAEIVVDGFDWKHHDEQCIRDALLYGKTVDFVRAHWEVEKQMQFKGNAPEFETMALKDRPVETIVMKEGLSWVNPHPSRLIVDNSEGICSINTDGGCQYIGYWDVCRFGDIKDNPAFFNRDCITYGATYWDVFANYRAYFNQYYSQLKLPQGADTVTGWLNGNQPSADNDRKNLVGMFSAEQIDMAMFKAEYFRRVIPKDIGCGEYPFPVWMRIVVAGDTRIIYAQFLPSTPAAVLSINEKDDRQINASFAMDLLWAQDMMSNLVNNLLLSIQQDLFKVFGINTDMLEDNEVEAIKSALKGNNWANDPLVIPFSLKKFADELGIKTDALFKISETRGSQNLQYVFQAMTELMSLVDRMLAMSPAENGQPAPREISATEVAEISTTTTSVYSFISDDIDEFRAAKKRILYDSMIVCRQRPVMAPVIGRYTRKTVEAAGFKVVDDKAPVSPVATSDAQARTVTGSPRNLVHDYIFTTRDGAERPVNTQAANSLVQLLQVVLQVPVVVNKLGKEKIYDMFNEVFRLSGAGVDLNLEMADGEEEDFGADEMKQLAGVVDQLKQLFGQLADTTQQNAQGLADQEQVNAKQQAMLEGVSKLADFVKASAAKLANVEERVGNFESNPLPAIDYKTAPPDVKRQIESKNGFTPSMCDEGCDDAADAANAELDLHANAQQREIELQGAAAATTQGIVHKEAEHRQKIRHKDQEAEARREQRRKDAAQKAREKAAAGAV